MEIEIDTLYENMYPHTKPKEDKVKLLLVIRGYKRSDVHFRESLSGRRYLRYGYWNPIDKNDIEYVQELVNNIILEEFSIYDEDCGWKFGYDITSYAIQAIMRVQ